MQPPKGGPASVPPTEAGVFLAHPFPSAAFSCGNTENAEAFTVMIDKTPPVTTTSVVSGTLGTNGWYTSDVTVSLSATDNLSGIQNIYYQIDGGSVQIYSGSAFAVQGDLIHTITFWSVDQAGNTEHAETFTVMIDKTPPMTTASVASGTPGTNGWYTSDVTVSLNATDNLSGIQNIYYQIDGGSVQVYSGSPFAVQGDLVHTITFWSVDQAGNTEPAETFTVMIDKTPPTITISPPSFASAGTNASVSYAVTYSDANFQS